MFVQYFEGKRASFGTLVKVNYSQYQLISHVNQNLFYFALMIMRIQQSKREIQSVIRSIDDRLPINHARCKKMLGTWAEIIGKKIEECRIYSHVVSHACAYKGW
jgi:hypothetical protein